MKKLWLGRTFSLAALLGVLIAVSCSAPVVPTTSVEVAMTRLDMNITASPSPKSDTTTQVLDVNTPENQVTPDLTATYVAVAYGEESYRISATLQAAGGGVTFEPYPTWRAQQIGFATELAATLTAVAASPTPIPPLPFDAKWLIEGVVAELPGEYVEREIFSLYRKTWALLSFQASAPTEDFAQQLGEYMWQGTEAQEETVNAIVAGDDLAGCTFAAIAQGVEDRRRAGSFLRLSKVDFDRVAWVTSTSYDWYSGIPGASLPTVALKDRAYVESFRGLFLVGLYPETDHETTILADFEDVRTASGEVTNRESQKAIEMGRGFRSKLYAIWVPELSGWRLARLASPYCE